MIMTMIVDVDMVTEEDNAKSLTINTREYQKNDTLFFLWHFSLEILLKTCVLNINN